MSRQVPCPDCGMSMDGPCSHPACPFRKAERLEFDVHLPRLLREMIEGHPRPGPLVTAVNLTTPILRALAARAIELDDPALNVLMLRLALYDVGPDRVQQIEAQRARLAP